MDRLCSFSTALRPDAGHPITAGFSCPKGLEFVHVQNDDDRVLYPLRRRPDGTFEQISWDRQGFRGHFVESTWHVDTRG